MPRLLLARLVRSFWRVSINSSFPPPRPGSWPELRGSTDALCSCVGAPVLRLPWLPEHPSAWSPLPILLLQDHCVNTLHRKRLGMTTPFALTVVQTINLFSVGGALLPTSLGAGDLGKHKQHRAHSKLCSSPPEGSSQNSAGLPLFCFKGNLCKNL